MGIFKYIGLFILSIIVTFSISILDMLYISKTFINGSVGLPLAYSYGSISLFGEGKEEINYVTLILDFVFWFVILLLLFKYLPKLLLRLKK